MQFTSWEDQCIQEEKPEKNSFRFGPLTIVVYNCVHACVQCSIQCLVLILEFGSGNRL